MAKIKFKGEDGIFSKIGKRNLLIFAAVLLIGGAVVLNYFLFDNSGKVNYGFDAYNEKYVDMIPAGIVDPTKVTRSALQNAASVAAMVLTTESLVTDIKDPAADAAMAAAAGGGMGGMY